AVNLDPPLFLRCYPRRGCENQGARCADVTWGVVEKMNSTLLPAKVVWGQVADRRLRGDGDIQGGVAAPVRNPPGRSQLVFRRCSARLRSSRTTACGLYRC